MTNQAVPTQRITVGELVKGDMVAFKGGRFAEITFLSNGGNETILRMHNIDQARIWANAKTVIIAKRWDSE